MTLSLFHNAAIEAQRNAACAIATARVPRAVEAYLNGYGIFAWVDDQLVQLGTPEEAAPFAGLTTLARQVRRFFPGGGVRALKTRKQKDRR